jgi:hypothetical protein
VLTSADRSFHSKPANERNRDVSTTDLWSRREPRASAPVEFTNQPPFCDCKWLHIDRATSARHNRLHLCGVLAVTPVLEAIGEITSSSFWAKRNSNQEYEENFDMKLRPFWQRNLML